MKVSDYIVSFLADRGVTDAFGYPGGMVTHLMDSFDRQRGRIRAHVCYHEQGAAFAACGYAAASGRPGVAYATSGPGATNLMTGIADAYFDSLPCLFLTGQVNTYESKGTLPVRQKGFQEMDVVTAVRSYTKYAACVTDPAHIRFELEKAWALCLAGQPGPVLLDLPMNVQRQEIDPAALEGFPAPSAPPAPDVAFVLEALRSAARPCLLVGAGVKGAGMTETMRALAAALPVPVVTSMLAVDVLPAAAPRCYGFVGAYGDRTANFVLAKSDLIVSLGSRLDVRQIGGKKENFAPGARLIRFDIDADELHNRIKPDETAVCADLRDVLPRLLAAARTAPLEEKRDWIAVCEEIRSALAGYDDKAPNRMLAAVSRLIPDGAVITTDVGQNQVWAAQSFAVKPGQTMLFSGGHGAMGFALPAAIGAHYATGRPVVCLTGDGGLQMNLQELQLLRRESLPVKVVLFNNEALGMIRHFQEMYFDSHYVQTAAAGGYTTPSFAKLAAAYALPYARAEGEAGLQAEFFRAPGPAFLEVALQGDTYVFPKLAMGKPNQDQEPPIDRALYDRLMAL